MTREQTVNSMELVGTIVQNVRNQYKSLDISNVHKIDDIYEIVVKIEMDGQIYRTGLSYDPNLERDYLELRLIELCEYFLTEVNSTSRNL